MSKHRHHITLFLALLLLVLSALIMHGTTKLRWLSSSRGYRQNTKCIATFRDGGGPHYQPNAPMRENIAPPNHQGDILTVSGRVLANDCRTPLKGAVLDIWQADESGNYQADWYRGRVDVDTDGNYQFQTVVPKGYGAGTNYRPPHIHFKVHQDSRELVTSQMFLPAATNQGINSAYVIDIERKADAMYVYHDIIMP